jgi:hypothetical protein
MYLPPFFYHSSPYFRNGSGSFFVIIILTLFTPVLILNSYTGQDEHSQISVVVNDSPFPLSSSWIDSITTDLESAVILYKITGAQSDGVSVTTRIRLPQVLTLKEVVKQIILYYKLLDNEDERRNEELFIYPYFVGVNSLPYLRVHYTAMNTISVQLREWQTITRPPAPNPEECDIYNQIIEDSFRDVQEYQNIPDETFRKIAKKNNIPMESVIRIYKNVFLWQLTR